MHPVEVPIELVFPVERNLMQRGNIRESSRPSVRIGRIRQTFVGVVIASAAVPVAVILGPQLETLSCRSGFQIKSIAHFGVETSRSALGDARGQIGRGFPRHAEIARLTSRDERNQSRGIAAIGRVSCVETVQTQAHGVGKGADQKAVEREPAVVGQAERKVPTIV